MESFKTLLDDKNLDQLSRELSLFIHSADGYANRLKLTYALLSLIDESCTLLKTVDLDGFISDIKKRIEDVESQSNNLKEVYRRHLYSNKDISSVLANPDDNRVSNLQKEIERLLVEYDSILKGILEIREKLPVEKRLKEKEQK